MSVSQLALELAIALICGIGLTILVHSKRFWWLLGIPPLVWLCWLR